MREAVSQVATVNYDERSDPGPLELRRRSREGGARGRGVEGLGMPRGVVQYQKGKAGGGELDEFEMGLSA